MTVGIAVFLAVLGGFGGLWTLSWWMRRRTMARIGTAVGDVPDMWRDVLQGDALLWFHSPMCGPCRVMHPQVRALAAKGRAHEVDVTQHHALARALHVMATPTTVRVRGGKVVDVRLGVLTAAELDRLACR